MNPTYRHKTPGLIALLALIVGAASPGLAQNPVDPTQSSVESNCNFIILTPPGGSESDFGDNGIVVECRDADGAAVDGIPGSAMTIVALDGSAVWPVAAVPTNDAGKTLLTGYPGDSFTLIHGIVGVNIHLNGEDVLLDNGGAGILLELRSPDLNGDFQVNLFDVAVFAAAFGCCEDTEECLRADFTGDGCVDLADLSIFERYLGAISGAGAAVSRAGDRQDEALFMGCIQHDFDTDGNPDTINQEISVNPGAPFYLRFVAKDFRFISGTDFEIGIPNDVELLARATVPDFPLEIPVGAPPGFERVIVSGDCATTGPLFIYEFLFMSPAGRTYTIDDFPVVHARFADCQYVPEVHDACVGAPTPCEASYVRPGLEVFVTCPGGDLDTSDILTAVMKDQDGQGVPDLPADQFRVLLEDERGTNLAYMVRFTPMADATDDNGELPFRVELRESCRWDVCLDLFITVRHQSCDLYARKKIRTINVAPAVSHGEQADGVIDLADLSWWAAHEYSLDDCMSLEQNYRCPVVTPADNALVQDHIGHTCEIMATPLHSHARAVAMHQNEPNPFNPRTEIRVDLLRAAGSATVSIYDVQGRLVATVHDGALPAGSSRFIWDGRDLRGRAVASGTYIASVRALGDGAAVRMVLLR